MEWDNDPEAIISAGYTEKGLMQEAEEQVVVVEKPKTAKTKQKQSAGSIDNGANRWNSWQTNQ